MKIIYFIYEFIFLFFFVKLVHTKGKFSKSNKILFASNEKRRNFRHIQEKDYFKDSFLEKIPYSFISRGSNYTQFDVFENIFLNLKMSRIQAKEVYY
jgi:hypothetical protein